MPDAASGAAPSASFTLLAAHLRVASLARAEAFYVGVLGLQAASTPGGERALTTAACAEPLLYLREVPGALPAPDGAVGLFHLAWLVPARADLARVLLRLADRRWPLQGLSDHGVSEALYLADPDGSGVEIYADRPVAAWPRRQGRLEMYTARLDTTALLATARPPAAAGLPIGTRLGHVHLRVPDLAAAERFYAGELPLTVSVADFPGARFFAADGYHHQVGANTWGVRPAPSGPGYAGLDLVTARVAGLTEPRRLADPAGVRWQLEPAMR